MKNKDFSQMSEDELIDLHCDAIHEIAGITVGITNAQREVRKLVKTINKLDLELESREAKKMGLENKLN
jgi:hypothetical protein